MFQAEKSMLEGSKKDHFVLSVGRAPRLGGRDSVTKSCYLASLAGLLFFHTSFKGSEYWG